jgi:tRNA nucleotidyltransferase (CCA-adding enzyme)|tara:strand:- start:9701 stop:10327 length:627 start_codon:yes stop_codon:yes gene_type:complete
MSVFKHTMLAIEYAAKEWGDAEINFSVLCHDFGKKYCWDNYQNAYNHEKEGLPYILSFCNKWKVPNRYRDLALLVCEYHTKIHGCMGRSSNSWMRPKSIQKLFEETGAYRNPERFIKILKACEADSKGRGLPEHENHKFTREYFLNKPYHQREYLEDCLDAVISLDTKEISSKLIENGKCGKVIGLEIRAARINEIRKVQKLWKEKMK